MNDIIFDIAEFLSFGLYERPIVITPTMTTVELQIENGQLVCKSMKIEPWGAQDVPQA